MSVSNWLKAIVAIGASVVAIAGAMSCVISWAVHNSMSDVTDKISNIEGMMDKFHIESEAGDSKHERSLTRLELIMLMEHSPNNITEIEKVARYYFCTLKGDWYMTSVYTEWAQANGADIDIIVECENK